MADFEQEQYQEEEWTEKTGAVWEVGQEAGAGCRKEDLWPEGHVPSRLGIVAVVSG